MKQIVKKIKYGIAVFSITIFLNCTDKQTPFIKKDILIDTLNLVVIDTNTTYISLRILATYPLQKSCVEKDRYATLYVCEKRLTKPDTLYVLDECAKAPDFASDTSLNIETGISKRNIVKTPSGTIGIFVPPGFYLTKKSKVIFAKITGVLL